MRILIHVRDHIIIAYEFREDRLKIFPLVTKIVAPEFKIIIYITRYARNRDEPTVNSQTVLRQCRLNTSTRRHTHAERDGKRQFFNDNIIIYIITLFFKFFSINRIKNYYHKKKVV